MYNALIIDDEQDAIQVLSAGLKETFGDSLKIIGTANNLNEGLLLATEYEPNLIFLDIDLGNKESGFDVARALADHDYPMRIVFSTAYHQFAIKAIRTNAFDYLLKPIGNDDLLKLKERLDNPPLSKTQTSVPQDVIVINTTEALYKIKLENILYFKGDGNYTSVYLKDKERPILSSNTLNRFEEEVSSISTSFFRTHKSFLVNLNLIDHVKKEGLNRVVVMKNGDSAQISRLRYKTFSARYF